MAICLNNLARLLQTTSRLTEALPLMKRSVEVFLENARASGHSHQGLTGALANYRSMLCKAGKSEREALAIINGMLAPYGLEI